MNTLQEIKVTLPSVRESMLTGVGIMNNFISFYLFFLGQLNDEENRIKMKYRDEENYFFCII